MSLKDRIIKKIIKEEKEKFLTHLVQDPHESLLSILRHYDIPFSMSDGDIIVPLSAEEEIIINVKKQPRQI